MEKNLSSPARLVAADYEGQRLDNYLARELKGAPRSLIYRLIRSGQVRINSRRAKPDHKLCTGDLLRIPDNLSLSPPPAAAPPVVLPILFEDHAFLAVNKPAGMAVHGGSGVSFGVIERLRAARNPHFLELVHRLDKHTSGVLLLAKKSSALRAVQSLWRAREVEKIYQAWVFGIWTPQHKVIDLPIKRLSGSAIGSKTAADGRAALTRTSLLEQRTQTAPADIPAAANMALLQADIATGRTHQLRVHLSAVGLPIIGDDKYGNFAANRHLGTRRLFLHACRLHLPNPNGGELDIQAPPPDSFLMKNVQIKQTKPSKQIKPENKETAAASTS